VSYTGGESGRTARGNSDKMGLEAVAAWRKGDFRISLPFKRQKSQ
jgi:hypothetical protein